MAFLLCLLPALAGAAPLGFTVATSKAVVVDTSGGVPRVWLDFGGGEVRAATYRGGSGTQALEFAYDIVAGDFAPSGIIASGEIDLAGGAIRDVAGNPLTLTFTPPDLSGVKVQTYRAAWTTDPVTAANASAAAFQITKPPPGASFAWQITSDGGGSVSGSGTIAASPHPVTGLDLTALADGTLTLTVTLTTPAGTGAARTATVVKATTIDCTDPAILAANSPGARCADGSIYAGSLSGKHLITHVSGCGYEPGGSATTKAGAAFTPTCDGVTDSITKRWSNDPYGGNGAHSQGDGRLNTNQLIADVQYQNPAAAYCHHLDLYGQSDWYLPARDELNLLFQNRNVIGGFSGGAGSVWDNNSSIYWSSTEGILQFFSDGYAHGWFKTNSYRLRCIRTLAPPPAPSGYGVAWTSAPVTVANQGSGGFQLSSAPIGAAFSYAITSSGGGGAIRGAGAVTSASQSVGGINLSALPDGVLTVSVVLTNGGGSGAAATADAPKQTTPIDCADTAALAAAVPGATCTDGSVYAGSLGGTYLITTATASPTGLRWDNAGCALCGTGPALTGVGSLNDGRLNIAAMKAWVEGNTAADDLLGFDAARYCDDLAANGRTDWYLPARGELDTLHANRSPVGYTQSMVYWSSTETSSDDAWVMHFGIGSGYSAIKSYTATPHRALCVRRVALPPPAPSGYDVAWTAEPVNAGNAAAVAFRFASAEIGATFAYTVTSSGGGGAVTGGGTITGATEAVTGLDLSGLPDGTLTLSVTLSNAGGTGPAATDTALKDTAAPTGHGVAWTTDPVNAGNAAAGAFEISGGEVGAGFSYTITSDGGAGSVSGSGTASGATQAVAGLDLSGLPDGTLTVEVVLTDGAGNAAAAVTATAAKDAAAPTGHGVAWTTDPVNAGNAAAGAFEISGAEVGAGFAYEVTSSGGAGSVSGSGTVSGATQAVAGLDLSGLADGTLTVEVVLTDAAGNAAAAVSDTVVMDTAAPAGHGVAWTTDPVNAGNAAAGVFEISGAEVGAGFSYSVTSSGGAGSVSGSGTVASATQAVSGLDLSGLADGTLTVEVVLTDAAGNAAAAVSDTAAKDAAAPAGHGVAWTTDPVNAGNSGAGAFEITSAEVGAGFSYGVTSSGGAGSVSGSGTVATATQAVAGLDLSALADGTLTVSVVLTDAAGNAGAAVSDTVAKATAAAAYSVWWGTSPEITGQTFGSFNISGATVGASGAWTITSSGGAGSVSGTIASISGPTQGVSNVYLGDLPDGTLTVSFVQTVSGVAGPAATATIGKRTLDCTDAAALAAATPGARCQDGAIYAGTYNGAYYLTHRAGCGHNPGSGLPSSAASSDFTPSCTTLTDSISKIWSNSGGFDEGANDGGNGALNTQTLMADAQATNAAAAYCHHLVINGRSAWFLPSAGEAGVLWTNRSAILGFSGTYWTSTQSHLNPTTSVRSRNMSTGTTPDTLKTSSARLRCMHAAP